MLQFSIITISTFVTMLDSITIFVGKTYLKKDVSKYIPIFSIIYGVALGIAGFFTPNVEMGSNIIEAIFIGISAGAAATGINQVGKQLGKEDDSMSTAIECLNVLMETSVVPEEFQNDIESCDSENVVDNAEDE